MNERGRKKNGVISLICGIWKVEEEAESGDGGGTGAVGPEMELQLCRVNRPRDEGTAGDYSYCYCTEY